MDDEVFNDDDWEALNEMLGTSTMPNVTTFFALLKALNRHEDSIEDVAFWTYSIRIICARPTTNNTLRLFDWELANTKSFTPTEIKENTRFKEITLGILEQLRQFWGTEELTQMVTAPYSSTTGPSKRLRIGIPIDKPLE